MIHAGVGTYPNSDLMEQGIFGGYEVDGADGFPFELFELHNSQLCGEWASLSFSLSLLFFKEDSSTLLGGFDWEALVE